MDKVAVYELGPKTRKILKRIASALEEIDASIGNIPNCDDEVKQNSRIIEEFKSPLENIAENIKYGNDNIVNAIEEMSNKKRKI